MERLPPFNQRLGPENPPGNLRLGPSNPRGRAKKPKDPDQAVRDTDTDALIARFSAGSKKYFDDEFAEFFIPSNQTSGVLRPPWLNIGTHHRTYVIDALVERFIDQAEGPKQVLSLGSGSDTRYWRMKRTRGDAWPVARWVETDFKQSVGTKIQKILQNDRLKEICGGQLDALVEGASKSAVGDPAAHPPTHLHGKDYSLISVDLRQPDQLVRQLIDSPPDREPLLRKSSATLIIAELVFLYMPPDQTALCLQQLVSTFQGPLMIITYEALNLQDNFSKMMVQNLSARGLSLAGFDYNASVESQSIRLSDSSFTEIVTTDMKKLRDSTSTNLEWKTRWDKELMRIKRLEFLDEVEELELILRHYAVSWAIRHQNSPLRISQDFYLPNLRS